MTDLPGAYFHDITEVDQAITTNGLYPVTPGYDEATGIGTPRMAALITASSGSLNARYQGGRAALPVP